MWSNLYVFFVGNVCKKDKQHHFFLLSEDVTITILEATVDSPCFVLRSPASALAQTVHSVFPFQNEIYRITRALTSPLLLTLVPGQPKHSLHVCYVTPHMYTATGITWERITREMEP